MSFAAQASDHETLLDARRAGDIAPFGKILSAAHRAVGEQADFIDAKIQKEKSELLIKVILRKSATDEVVVVTVNAINARVVDIADRETSLKTQRSGGQKANSRLNDPPNSNSGSGKGQGSRGDKSERGKGDRDGGHGKKEGRSGRGEKDGSRK